MKKDYDAFIIGTGVAGSALAYKLKKAGMRVAIADKERFGGTCAFHGCIPKKILSSVAGIIDAGHRMEGKGAECSGQINWPDLINFKEEIIHSLTDPKEKAFINSGIDTYHGTVRFHDQNTLAIGEQLISAEHILITVGATSRTIDITGVEHLTTSDEFLDLEELPDKIIFAGGGYISFEFAHIAARAGAEVTIIHRSENLLKTFDRDLVKMLVDASQKAGINIVTNQELQRIEKKDQGLEVTTFDINGQEDRTHKCDMIVHGLGRVPAIQDLEPEKGDVDIEHGAIAVNEYLQSISNPAVYAAGDCIIPGPALTPTASLQANIVASNILKGNEQTADYTKIASAVFTIPTLASVGMMEKDASDEHQVIFTDMSKYYSARKMNVKYSASKVIIEKDTRKIVGAHLIGPDAENIINLYTLAINTGLTAEQVREALYAYPSGSYDVKYMLK
ncbi:dihydrolipoyl dehydrogenase family protein [Methanolobus profundi]|uniref:Glutathione reductase (NADPH) n=1 Tax=Methanolobus profundi TaxID=487685 RepID=A0A1I4S5F0_9EURY|nr:NAD(P)/FAD-dependent oxidoreductase [Methanolobus profundi]SFM59514.1 glutathione reductase (NADPH) [Methanolobus profundi]